jgi:predicted N-acetyltransferase YhbS
MTDGVTVREGELSEVLPLRRMVLRPGQEVRPSDYDSSPGIRHVVAVQGDEVVGCATIYPSAHDGEVGAWQLRGMAVAPDLQGKGIGAAVLRVAIDIARGAGAPLLWANARVTALGFYERLGFEVVGEEYVYGPLELPHKLVRLAL